MLRTFRVRVHTFEDACQTAILQGTTGLLDMLSDIDSLALFVRAAGLRRLTQAAEAPRSGLAAASRSMALLKHRFDTTFPEGNRSGAAGGRS